MANPLWSTVGNGKIRCLIHREVFAKGGSCAECASVVAPSMVAVDQLEEVAAPAGALTSAQLEARFISIASYAESTARELLAAPETSGSGVRLLDTAIKALRAAGEHCLDRERLVQTRRLEASLRRAKDARSFS